MHRNRWLYLMAAVPILLLLLAASARAQRPADPATAPQAAADAIWHDVNEAQIVRQGPRRIVPDRYRTLAADLTTLDAQLAAAPQEQAVPVRNSAAILALPLPDGTFGRFRYVDSPVMEPALAAQFPDIHTYLGQGLDDPTATVRFDRTPAGFHAMILSANGTIFIDPYSDGDTVHYISYAKADYPLPDGKTFRELGVVRPNGATTPANRPDTASGTQLRTYRLALAADGEYTQFFGGTVAQALAGMTTSVNRVDGVYEREVAVRMVMIANETAIIYTDPNTDPYTNNDGIAMLTENQSNLDSVIGSANYDIGHVFSTGGGGVAELGAVCQSGLKAQGVTGSPNPTGDGFDIDYVAHEMGHQFGSDHSFNGTTSNCGGGNRAPAEAYEPGSGSTIMAYAGICGSENLQPHSDDYFHTISFDRIVAFTTTGGGNTCAAITATGNTPPVPNAGASYTIPNQTYFKLTGSATDADGDPLTYNWEQFNLGAAAPPNTDDGTRPIFRSFPSRTSPTRFFPKLSDILNNTTTFGESLPTTNRTLTFRLTVRDNRAGGGGVDYRSVNIPVTTSSGPFVVTAPNTAVTWAGGSSQTVTWNVANTTAAPVSCAQVNILLSTDGGNTFPTNLATNTANDGTQLITVPNLSTTQARVQVICASNIFFDISNVNFTITAGGTPLPVTPSATPTPGAAATPCAITFTDVDASNPFYSFIRCLACRQIVSGYSDGTFRWGANVTRGQVSKIVSNAANFTDAVPSTQQSFEDIVPNSTFWIWIERLATRGYISGYTCGGAGEPCQPPGNRPYFRANNDVTRGQLAKIVSSAAGYADAIPTTQQTFTDVPPTQPFWLWIERVALHGVINGYADNTFRPGASATRGQTAKVVANAFYPNCTTPAR